MTSSRNLATTVRTLEKITRQFRFRNSSCERGPLLNMCRIRMKRGGQSGWRFRGQACPAPAKRRLNRVSQWRARECAISR